MYVEEKKKLENIRYKQTHGYRDINPAGVANRAGTGTGCHRKFQPINM